MTDLPTATGVPEYDPDQWNGYNAATAEGDRAFPRVLNPYTGIWWASQTVTGVPEEVMGWLTAQGWEITATAPDATTSPPTMYYALEKTGLRADELILSLCNNYTISANDARDANIIRYKEVVEGYEEMLSTAHDHFDAQITEQNTTAGLYLTDLETALEEIDGLIDANQAQLEIDRSGIDTALEWMQSKIPDLETNAAATNAATEALLTNLGTTEVARIIEQFAATLSVQLQKLIDDGLYTSAIAADITERNHRDRDEQLQLHYDRIYRIQAEDAYKRHDILQGAVKDTIASRGQYVSSKLQAASTMAEHKHRAIVEKMNAAAAKLDGWKGVAAENRQLMAYQLDERNKLLIGLYSFVERREDIAPEWRDIANIITQIGANSGKWISP